MSTSERAVDRRAGLKNAIDIVVDPNAAFARLRRMPTWGWAFLIAALLAGAGALLLAPATSHALQTSLPPQLAASPEIAKMPPEQQQRAIAAQVNLAMTFQRISSLFVPIVILIVALFQALIMLIANGVARGDGNFKKFFALSITVAVVGTGLGTFVLGLIVLVRGASTFETTTAIAASSPSLALLVPNAHGALAGFLGAMNVFALWSTVLLALGMSAVARVPRGAAWATAVLILAIGAGIGALSALTGG